MPKALPPEVRERLLEAAEAVVWRIGFAKMTIDEIAQAASISKGAVYRFFESKEEIGDAIVARHTDALYARQKELSSYGEHSYRERLAGMLMVPVEMASAKYQKHSYGGDMAATIFGPGKRALKTVSGREASLYAQILRAGKKAGEFRSTNAARTADVLSLAISAYLPPYIWLDDPKTAVPDARVAIELLLDGLSAASGK